MRKALTAGLFLGLLGAGCGMRPAMAESDSLRPGPYDPLIARFVHLTLKGQHIATPDVDDTVSERWLEAYLNRLDPQHWYFLASDIREFRAKYAHTLDDDLKGDAGLEAAFEIYARLQQRVQERVASARRLLEADHDFTVKESWVFDRGEMPWPATQAEADDLWRRYVKNELLGARLADQDETETLELLRKRWDRVERNILETEAVEVRETYLNALTTTFDPHTNYFRPTSAEDFNIDLMNQLEGIGAVLGNEDGYTVVRSVVKGGPADKSGQLEPGDRITAVAQDGEEPVDIVEMRLDRVVQLIRGRKGSKVHLTVIPSGGDSGDRKQITIVRDQVEISHRLASADVRTVMHNGRRVQVGVLELPSFYPRGRDGRPDASEDVERLLGELSASNVDVVVFDLRQNGGGSLQEAVEIGGLFIDKGPIVQIDSPNFGAPEILRDTAGGVAWGGPLVVLTSPLSASASEIVAGAVQDYGRGIVVGSRTTHGKGTVQTLVPLDDILAKRVGRRLKQPTAGQMKLTTQKFYRVTGASTQFKGVESDIVLPSPWDGYDIYESDLDNALPWDQIASTRFQRVGDLSRLIPELQTRSTRRISDDVEFQKIRDKTSYVIEQKDRKEVSLVLDERRKEREAFEARFGTDEQEVEMPSRLDEDEKGPDPILDETLRIAADLVQLTS